MNRTFASASAVTLLAILGACAQKDGPAKQTPSSPQTESPTPVAPPWGIPLSAAQAFERHPNQYGQDYTKAIPYLELLLNGTQDDAIKLEPNADYDDVQSLFQSKPYSEYLLKAKMFVDVEDTFRTFPEDGRKIALANFGRQSREPDAPVLSLQSINAGKELLSRLNLPVTDENARAVAYNAEVRFNVVVEAHTAVNAKRNASGEEPAPLF
jgi:hypothetical protein